MGIVASLKYKTAGYALSETLDAVPSPRLDFVQEMATDPDRPYLWFWVYGCEPTVFEEAMEADETVAEYTQYVVTETNALYRIHLSEEPQIVNYPMWVDVGAELMDGGYRDGWWRTRLRVADRADLSAVQDWFERHDVTFELERVSTNDSRRNPGFELSEEQRRVLEVALEKGYFDIPRRGSLADVAAELGISSQAASERLRRGHRQLVSYHL